MRKLSRRFFLKATMTVGGVLAAGSAFAAGCGFVGGGGGNDDDRDHCRYGYGVSFIPGYGFRLRRCR
jgi:hypothetical protein